MDSPASHPKFVLGIVFLGASRWPPQIVIRYPAQMPDDDRHLALAFVAELEKAVAAIRSGSVDGIAYAEVQPTSLFLLERSERFHALLRERFAGLAYDPTTQAMVDALARSDCELAGMISGFIECVFDLVNADQASGDAGAQPGAG